MLSNRYTPFSFSYKLSHQESCIFPTSKGFRLANHGIHKWRLVTVLAGVMTQLRGLGKCICYLVRGTIGLPHTTDSQATEDTFLELITHVAEATLALTLYTCCNGDGLEGN